MPSGTVAAIAFLSFSSPSFPVAPEKEARCKLEWSDTVAETGEVILLGGAARCSQFGTRSVLIRSEDAGRTWKEVGTPLEGRTVAFLRALKDGTATASLSHIEEGPGPETLIRSTDGGRSWKRVADIPKGEHLNQVKLAGLDFSDRLTGKADLQVLTGTENEVHVDLRTRDGGINWLFVGARTIWGKPEEKSAATPEPTASPDADSHIVKAGKAGNTIRLPKDVPLSLLAKVK